jgi:hypothetical protein
MLDAFYTAHLDDERSLLFDKQRLKLRKLLAEYDAAVASLSSGSAMQHSHADGAADGGAHATHGTELGFVVSRQINEDSRLTLDDLLAWFNQAGANTMPEVTAAVVEKVFHNITRTNLDGKMSIRDLRQWYLTFGKRALREGVGNFDSEVVPAALVKTLHPKVQPKYLPAERTKPMYAWEEGKESSGSPSASGALGSSGLGMSSGGSVLGRSSASVAQGGAQGQGSIGLPNHMLEFQVRLTAEEFHAMAMKKRSLEAELRYKERVQKAHEKERLSKGLGASGIGKDVPDSIFREMPYSEGANSNLNTLLYRK